MPFITKDRRLAINHNGLNSVAPIQMGDLCYVHYRKMVERSNLEPRWTTAHEIKADIFFGDLATDKDDFIAKELAWEVFFQLYVMPYELKKRAENGDI
jgi:hypothetical protein